MDVVIAAVDNSAAARPVVRAAGLLAALTGSRVEAVHVREDGDATAREIARRAGLILVEYPGPVVETLGRLATRDDVAALVLGARGTPAGRRPVGGVTLAVVTAAERPVLVVPPTVAGRAAPRRVLVPLDGTPETAAALTRTIDLASRSRAQVVVLHVHGPETLPPFSDQPHHEAEAWASEFLARNCPTAREVDVWVRVGAAGEHVLAVADDLDADLIALGWSRDLSPGRAEVVREVLSRSNVPILLVPMNQRR